MGIAGPLLTGERVFDGRDIDGKAALSLTRSIIRIWDGHSASNMKEQAFADRWLLLPTVRQAWQFQFRRRSLLNALGGRDKDLTSSWMEAGFVPTTGYFEMKTE
ncbi:hypothetical protein Nepgr_026563 [Nepenthes gracilis]|uniref:Uncharacterized protein n=1 Tax=Nepenthes gracilis TaxID=150966 RepID=A0AAD3Y254_NEPGR|nr:hypothetical protein Nepgr_026563 [Nepenthes gracilis]